MDGKYCVLKESVVPSQSEVTVVVVSGILPDLFPLYRSFARISLSVLINYTLRKGSVVSSRGPPDIDLEPNSIQLLTIYLVLRFSFVYHMSPIKYLSNKCSTPIVYPFGVPYYYRVPIILVSVVVGIRVFLFPSFSTPLGLLLSVVLVGLRVHSPLLEHNSLYRSVSIGASLPFPYIKR